MMSHAIDGHFSVSGALVQVPDYTTAARLLKFTSSHASECPRRSLSHPSELFAVSPAASCQICDVSPEPGRLFRPPPISGFLQPLPFEHHAIEDTRPLLSASPAAVPLMPQLYRESIIWGRKAANVTTRDHSAARREDVMTRGEN